MQPGKSSLLRAVRFEGRVRNANAGGGATPTLVAMLDVDAGEQSPAARQSRDGMLFVPGDTFRMGSDRHYPEEAPVHYVSVDGFWIDRTPITNGQFRKFINATGYVTFAEKAPEASDYPGALPCMLKAGSLVFTPPKHAVD